MRFPIHDLESAPTQSRKALEGISNKYGFIPNLAGVFATSPGALDGLLGMLEAFEAPTLKLAPIERQVVLLAVSVENRCEYCTAAHSMVVSRLGLAREHIDRIQMNQSLDGVRLESLRVVAQLIVQNRGRLSEEELRRFREAGFEEAHLIEVILGVAIKTLTNYVNHIAQPEVNEQFAEFLPCWTEVA